MKRHENSLQVAKKPGSNEAYFDAAGQINAGSTKEVFAVLSKMMSDIASGRISTHSVADVDASNQRRAMFEDTAAAWRDRNPASTAWADIGAAIALEITETLSREGLMRRVYAPGEINQGETPRIRVKTKNVSAVVATGIGSVASQYIRDRFVEPPEFYISASPRVTEIDINQGAPDLLEDVFLRAQEAILVAEDKTWYNAAVAAVGISNDFVALTGGLTPTNLSTLRQSVTRWNLSAENLIIGSETGNALLNNTSGFSGIFDPVTQYEAVRTAKLGTLFGMTVSTDGFRDPNQVVLGSRDVIITSSPTNHGGYTERNGGVVANPVDESVNGIPARGWFMYEILSNALVNPRSFAFGTVS